MRKKMAKFEDKKDINFRMNERGGFQISFNDSNGKVEYIKIYKTLLHLKYMTSSSPSALYELI